MFYRSVSKVWICTLGLLLCGHSSAQINFFECAKNPEKCRPAPSSTTSESSSTGSELSSAKFEEELQNKITAELERREKIRVQTKESERASLEEELRQKITAELERRQRERTQTKVENSEPAKPTIDKSIRIATLPYKKALIIGNDTYEFVAKLQNARADAQAMAKSLSNLGWL